MTQLERLACSTERVPRQPRCYFFLIRKSENIFITKELVDYRIPSHHLKINFMLICCLWIKSKMLQSSTYSVIKYEVHNNKDNKMLRNSTKCKIFLRKNSKRRINGKVNQVCGRKSKYCKDTNFTFICISNAMFIWNPPVSPIKISIQSKVRKGTKQFFLKKGTVHREVRLILFNCKAYLRTRVCFGAGDKSLRGSYR